MSVNVGIDMQTRGSVEMCDEYSIGNSNVGEGVHRVLG